MTVIGVVQIVVYLAVLLALVKPLGAYMARVYEGKHIALERVLGPVERLIYRICGVDPPAEMTWKAYGLAMLLFSVAGVVSMYAIQRLQGVLPLNPQHMPAVAPDLALNTAVSFNTNTNWQNYGGESTMGYLTQMLGMTVHNFMSAAVGMAILIAFIRGLVRQNAQTIGNFWVDLTRGTLYILLPLSVILAMILVSQGVVQTFSAYRTVSLVQPHRHEQTIALGPVASQAAIKHLGTNGGGFFNANAAHPFENPTPVTDFLLVLSQTMIAAALTYTFGRMVGDTRKGWALLAAMMVILTGFTFLAYCAESRPNPRLAGLGVDQTTSALQPGGNMEGKEVRFGIARSALFATTTTATSCGAVDAMHDSFTPLGGMAPLVMMQLGEVVLGGVGSGLYGMLVLALATVFIAGLMVGRTPEYLGKKIEAYEMKMVSLLILIMPMTVLVMTAVACTSPSGLAGISNPGPHGFSQLLYAFSSMANNNGSAFAGLNGNTPFFNLTGSLVMLIGRFWLAIPTLALAGSLARKKSVAASAGTFPTHSPLFVALLVGSILIVGLLTFVPALALGPIVEHLML